MNNTELLAKHSKAFNEQKTLTPNSFSSLCSCEEFSAVGIEVAFPNAAELDKLIWTEGYAENLLSFVLERFDTAIRCKQPLIIGVGELVTIFKQTSQ